MSVALEAKQSGVAKFRTKLLVAMMLVVVTLTALGLYLAQRTVSADVARDLARDFESQLASLHGVQELRHTALAERCRELVAKPRIHAALEDNALDLLYPSAKDELRDLMDSAEQKNSTALRAHFYRFLDRTGAVIPPPNQEEVGALAAEEEARLALPGLPASQQLGYLLRKPGTSEETVDEAIALPITSTETGELIAALLVGFHPAEVMDQHAQRGLKSGIWLQGWLHLPAVGVAAEAELDREMTASLKANQNAERSLAVNIDSVPHLLFYKLLNPGSLFPPAYEVCVYPLTESIARRSRLQNQILIAGGLLLLAGFTASHFVATRFARPVESLAVASEWNLARRRHAETALEATSEELQRSARFSADASHQLKSPVTILRLGLDRLLTRDDLPEPVYDEISALLHQTYRLTGVIDDLLLLSQMDAGRLRLNLTALNLNDLVNEWLDDFSALPDAADVAIETDIPPDLQIKGEKRYTTLIVQNLLENARKYNRPGGRIRIAAHAEEDTAILAVGNTGRAISEAGRAKIFERFHRGSVGENLPGHGLGLNLARQLARLHRGELRLAHSADDWTEFEVCFELAVVPAAETA